ncbi:DUF2062 domain-containing protein [Motilimonas sp. 1_MG-2023]|uniref:DUF2062 domain-containing protein n=1 Tax=Motilimonas TaxID=1914248 RepID=UPI0026E1C31C|nr:DUF2062 domain-containing protein [Motilimonas sp. 1_MG-2023]MDO6524732.1 DUF2062 domain-containing protein [Motilimonas sp. 1_MG-2023]
MPKKLIKRYTPNPETLKNHKHLKIFGDLLHDANLWHLNRRSAAGAFAVGLFMCWIPLPSQMIMAAGLAILFRVNLPLSVALVWISNPITMPPMFYFAYLIGAYCLQQPIQHWQFELSWQWLMEILNTIGPALLLGCGLLAVISAALGYLGIHWLWRLSVIRNRSQRKSRKFKK